MSLFGNLFRGRKTDDEVLSEVAELAADTDFQNIMRLLYEAVEAEKVRLIEGLSHPSLRERQAYADFIIEQVAPALEDEPRLDRRQQSLATLARLVSDGRPPNNAQEADDFSNAIFWFTKRMVFSQVGGV